MKLHFTQHTPGLADGIYQVTANGIAASLHWADENGMLKNWQPLAFLPIPPEGTGACCMTGGRAIPEGATHILARAVSADFSHVEEISVPIPAPAAPAEPPRMRFLLLTDLHLSRKAGVVRRALAHGKEYDAVLITGDLTNDGTSEQFALFWEILNETLPDTPVFAVAGNHDYPTFPLPHIFHGVCEYPVLQEKLLDRAAAMGWEITRDQSGAYAARKENAEILGLNAAWHWRRFKFPEGAQLVWLNRQLSEGFSGQRILLCHAPLRLHRPYKPEDDVPYLSMDKRLQEILDDHSGLLFLSGHTHLSLNLMEGCTGQDAHGNLYCNAGSIRPTTLKPEEPLQPKCWTEGSGIRLSLTDREISIRGFSLRSGDFFPRANYRFSVKDPF